MSKRLRWKSVIAFAVILVVSVIALCLLASKTPERKGFVGNMEPESGYRCRFTLSSSWRVTGRDIALSPGVLDNATFKPARSPIREWIDRVLLHRQTAIQPMIGLRAVTKDTASWSDFKYQAGYPELWLGPREHILTRRRLWIDNCPATVVSFELARSHPHTLLSVAVPDHSVVFMIRDGNLKSEDLNREMQAIISSFHIEKVAVGAGVKR
jgi:hypothetical protein